MSADNKNIYIYINLQAILKLSWYNDRERGGKDMIVHKILQIYVTNTMYMMYLL